VEDFFLLAGWHVFCFPLLLLNSGVPVSLVDFDDTLYGYGNIMKLDSRPFTLLQITASVYLELS